MYDKWISQKVRQLTKSGWIQHSPYNIIAEWVKHAWDTIDTQLIERSFKCCGISTATDGSEEDLIFDNDRVKNNKVEEYIYSGKLFSFTT